MELLVCSKFTKKEELFDIISSKAKHVTRLQDNKNYFGF